MTLSQALPTGTLLGRDFEIIRVLSQGGMGTVYEAIQRTTGAPRAVKIMRGGIAGDLRFRARFEQEARVSAKIPSDHIVQVVSAGVDEVTGVPWIAMELLDGEDLANFLQRRGRMDLHNARLAINQLCHALSAAHSVGVVHRDLKPENVFLGKARVVGVPFMVKVLDFGVAKILNEARAATIAVGTPLFMAPEQTYPTADIGPSADVWALGLLVFRMLVGEHYWLAASGPEPNLGALWREVLVDALPTASERVKELSLDVALPPGFDGWFSQCVAREAGERFANAELAYSALAPLLDAAQDSGRTSSAPVISSGATSQDLTPVSTSSLTIAAMAPKPAGASIASMSSKENTKTKARVVLREGPERVIVDTPKGTTLLEASLGAGVHHYHACGGKARCTTCRVVVLDGASNCGPRTEAEALVAEKRRWPSSIRLACQLRVLGDVSVRRLVVDQDDVASVNLLNDTQEPVTQSAVIVVAQLAGFEAFAREQFPHDTVHVLNRYMKQIVEPALANHGAVLQYLPSGAILRFTGDTEGRDGSLHALRAALRMIARVRQLNPYTLKHFGSEFALAVGIDTGSMMQALIGHPTRREPVFLGGAVDGARAAARCAADRQSHIVATSAFVESLGDTARVSPAFEDERKRSFREVYDFARPDVVFLVQSTFEMLAPKADEFGSAFYERLFEQYPAAQSLFANTDMVTQRAMLIDVLAKVVKGFDRIEDILPDVRELGRRHISYGVQPVHYKFVGRALLEALEQFLGEHFTPEVHVAWMEMYAMLARTMIEPDAPSESGERAVG
ncbi:MAG: protein kinase [Myxococcales bacterium]|nr:protein kinase [Myxococcales bacterium]